METPHGWENERGMKLRKTIKFPDFMQALAFVNRIAPIAEAAGHHPDIYLGWGRVRVELTTHDAGRVTDKDVRLAEQIDKLPTN
jgi:4a-hydroxytetrahydrobiopterin dehydratase